MSLFKFQLAKKGKAVELLTRSISDGFNGSETAEFSVIDTFKAIPCTPSGKTVFDDVDTETDVTNEFHCEHPGYEITAEHWIRFKSKLYRVLRATNCEEEDERFILECTSRGLTTKVASGG